jgi:hypothetical protein
VNPKWRKMICVKLWNTTSICFGTGCREGCLEVKGNERRKEKIKMLNEEQDNLYICCNIIRVFRANESGRACKGYGRNEK